jgi:hypothetical protein
MGVKVSIPRARVQGSLRVGDKTRAITGWAVAIHQYENRPAPLYLDKFWQLRHMDATGSLSLSQLQSSTAHGGEKASWGFMADARGRVSLLRGIQVETSGAASFQCRARAQDADIGMTVHKGQRLQRFRLTQDLNSLVALIVRLVFGDVVMNTSEVSLSAQAGERRFEGKGLLAEVRGD